ncbi:O-antigen ligase family protein [Sporomusa sp.]|uniref:O-antigen ligase family protein n=1 Tax=Sporomusa sp. TaxID=2078658 RepID=UPI002C912147|nr:O-antigen ligase family protein [Sporomusa sp.]HWR45835.1 O-antigen ligase family protein [Sporomusa sp.]
MKCLDTVIVLLMTMVLFFPSSYPVIKFGFLAFLLLAYMVESGKQCLCINSTIFFLSLVAIILGLSLNLYDVFLNGLSTRGLNVFVIDICVYLAVMLLLSTRPNINLIFDRAFHISSLLISTNALLYLLFSVSIGRESYPLMFLDLDYRMGLGGSGLMAFSTNNLPILIFTLPYMLVHYFYGKTYSKWKKMTLSVCLLASFFSLRIALIGVIVLSICCLVLYKVLRTKKKLYFLTWMMSLSMMIFSLSLIFTDGAKLDEFYNLKLANKLNGSDIRYEQFDVWYGYFQEAPLFGHGLTSVNLIIYKGDQFVHENVGVIENPFGYELTFAKLLVEIGLIPFLIYTVLTMYIIIQILKIVRDKAIPYQYREYALAHMFGIVSFIISANTNGYLLTFGYLWVIFFPLTSVARYKIKEAISL